jgi:hypothetical protein
MAGGSGPARQFGDEILSLVNDLPARTCIGRRQRGSDTPLQPAAIVPWHHTFAVVQPDWPPQRCVQDACRNFHASSCGTPEQRLWLTESRDSGEAQPLV